MYGGLISITFKSRKLAPWTCLDKRSFQTLKLYETLQDSLKGRFKVKKINGSVWKGLVIL